MTEAVTLTELRDEHMPALFQLLNDVYRIEVGSDGIGFKREGEERYGSIEEVEELRRQGSIVVAEAADGAVVGAIFYKFFYDADDVDQRSRRLYFGPLASIRKGVGRRLIQLAEETARREQCASVDIRVVNVRTDVLPMYQRNGYSIIREEPFPEPAVCVRDVFFYVLRKPL